MKASHLKPFLWDFASLLLKFGTKYLLSRKIHKKISKMINSSLLQS